MRSWRWLSTWIFETNSFVSHQCVETKVKTWSCWRKYVILQIQKTFLKIWIISTNSPNRWKKKWSYIHTVQFYSRYQWMPLDPHPLSSLISNWSKHTWQTRTVDPLPLQTRKLGGRFCKTEPHTFYHIFLGLRLNLHSNMISSFLSDLEFPPRNWKHLQPNGCLFTEPFYNFTSPHVWKKGSIFHGLFGHGHTLTNISWISPLFGIIWHHTKDHEQSPQKRRWRIFQKLAGPS